MPNNLSDGYLSWVDKTNSSAEGTEKMGARTPLAVALSWSCTSLWEFLEPYLTDGGLRGPWQLGFTP